MTRSKTALQAPCPAISPCLRGESLQSRLNFSRQRAEVRHSLQFVIRKLHVKMILQLGQEIERLQAVDPQRLEEIVIGSELLPRHLEMRRGKTQYFIQRLICSLHGFLSMLCQSWAERKTNAISLATALLISYGKYGCASVLSTNFRNPASTAGLANSSQNKLISRRNSSCGIGLMNFFAAAAVA